ncbi:hypothetical protein [Mesorhizobium sp. M0047]|uniref:hypothetical protein n=1 Tax=Mesorhizobium sp. M0047 TaxID=2956859 RepID=UPI00333B02CB
MTQLYAVCRPAEIAEVRHIQLANPLQAQLNGVFENQEAQFMAGIANAIAFTGDWIPDSEDVLFIQSLPEAQALLAAADQNAVALPVLDVANFQDQSVKGLFAVLGNGPNRRLLIQNFGPQQVLSNRFAFLYEGDVFRRLVEPAFSLDNKLVATVDAIGLVRFKSYSMLRRVLDMSPVFRDATDPELAAFCGHASLAIGDAAAFVAGADEGIRKHVLAITKANVLGNHPVANIQAQAVAIGFPIAVNAGRIEIPADRKGAKALFSFLLNKVYLGPIDQQLFITNSNRPLA